MRIVLWNIGKINNPELFDWMEEGGRRMVFGFGVARHPPSVSRFLVPLAVAS